MSERLVYVIPGFRQKPTHKAYKDLAKILRKQGFKPVLVSIPWKESTISENTDYFIRKFKQTSAKKKYILGFSFGAMIAFLASTKVSSSGLILCSLSPFFKEDLSKRVGKSPLAIKRYEDFSTFRSGVIARKVKPKKILMLYGINEEKKLINRVNRTYTYLPTKHKRLISIKQTPHEIGSKNYLATIQHLVTDL